MRAALHPPTFPNEGDAPHLPVQPQIPHPGTDFDLDFKENEVYVKSLEMLSLFQAILVPRFYSGRERDN